MKHLFDRCVFWNMIIHLDERNRNDFLNRRISPLRHFKVAVQNCVAKADSVRVNLRDIDFCVTEEIAEADIVRVVFVSKFFVCVDLTECVCNVFELLFEEFAFFSLCKLNRELVLLRRNNHFADVQVLFSKLQRLSFFFGHVNHNF